MKADFILDSIRKKYPKAAIVPEITIDDDWDLLDGMGYPGKRPEGHKVSRRIDALMFETLIRTAIEIKVTKEDFNRDTYWKRRMWQRHCHRFIYAVPFDLDVMSPHGCGLWKVFPDGSIKVVKAATVSKTPEPLPQTVVQRMAYRISGNL